MGERATKLKIGTEKNFISAIVEKPESNPKGIIIFLPGYLDSKDYRSFVHFSKKAASLGFIAIRFDPTGTWESSGSIDEYSISQYLKDIESVISFAKRNYKIADKIILIGHSLGGAAGILYASAFKEISLVVSIQPSQLKGRKPGIRISERDSPGGDGTKVRFEVPHSFSDDVKNYDVLDAASKITSMLFLIAGGRDEKVSCESIEKIYKNANCPKQFEILNDIGHDFRKSEAEIKMVWDKIEKALRMDFHE